MAKRTTTSKLRLLQRCIWGGVPLRIPHDIRVEYKKHTCYPPFHQIFRAFKLCPYDDVRVVIIGQDPYPGKGKANGLSFSSNAMTGSLKQIKREVERAGYPFESGDLTSWANQGVLLMNTYLTVKHGQARSHRGYWNSSKLTQHVLEALNKSDKPIVFLLWGASAIQLAEEEITNSKHLKLKASHPSPRSAFLKCTKDADQAFLECNHFFWANYFLYLNNRGTINWSTP